MIRTLQISAITLLLFFFISAALGQTDGLVGYWSFDDSTAADSSGYANHGTMYGDPNCIAGVKGAAIEFDGINDYIIIPDSDWLDTDSMMTISLWIRPDSLNSEGSKFISKWYTGGGNADWLFSLSSKDSCGGSCVSWFMYVANYHEFGYVSTGPRDVSKFLQMWQWNHIAVTFDTGLVKSYFNGELIDEVESDVKYTSLIGPTIFFSFFLIHVKS